MSTAKAKRPGAGVKASPDSASPDQRQSAAMRPLATYFKYLKARLDAYSERQLDEMDKYQNRKTI
jgi:hypothetical protein